MPAHRLPSLLLWFTVGAALLSAWWLTCPPS